MSPQFPTPVPKRQQGNGVRKPVQAALSLVSQNPVPGPVQHLDGAGPDVQELSSGAESMTSHNPIPEPRQHATGLPRAMQRVLLNPQNPVFLPVQQGNGLRTSMQAALSVIAQNPVFGPRQQLSGAAPDVQAASVGCAASTWNVASVVQNIGLWAGICREPVRGGVGGMRGAVHKKSRGVVRGVIIQGMVPPGGLGRLGQVVVKVLVNAIFGPSGSGAHVGSTS